MPAPPILVVLKDGITIPVTSGNHDICTSHTLIKIIEQGAFAESKTIEKGPWKMYAVISWIANRGKYFKNA